VVCLAQSTTPLESSTEGNVYTNFFFRFRYPFSSSWVPQSMDVVQQLEKEGRTRLDDEKPPNAEKHYNLLTLFRNFPGQGPNGHSRAIIEIIAEELSSHREITSGRECVLKLTDRLKKAHYTPMGDPQETQISKQTYFRQDVKGKNSSGVPEFQSYIFTINRGHALGFILVAPSQLMLNNMLETVNKTEFY
jgi:hypothetical protein